MRWLVTTFAMSLCLAVQAEEPSGSSIYKKTIPSVAWIFSKRSSGYSTGTGTLIDVERRLVLTNYHVVESNPKASVYFPVFRDGRAIPERAYYQARGDRLALQGNVILLNKQADLALIQLDQTPKDVAAVPIAEKSVGPGDRIHSIGNAGKSGALWGYVSGTVRQVYNKRWKAKLGRNTVNFQAKVVETDSPTNPGDSGGPLLNDAGELVGVTQGGAIDAQLVSFFIDRSEVEELLQRREVQQLKKDAVRTQIAGRTTPLSVTDNAKIFSDEATKSANERLAWFYKQGFDMLIETHTEAPKEWLDKAIMAKPEEREKLFNDWLEELRKERDASGIAILICMKPRYIGVQIPGAWRRRFPKDFASTLASTLIENFKAMEYDKALNEVIESTKKAWDKGKE